jgi:hypothetical protein
MILAGLIGSLSASSGATPGVAWSSIAYSAVNEGQQNTVSLNLTNWDGSEIDWYLVDTGGTAISNITQVTPNAGVLSTLGTGSSENAHCRQFCIAQGNGGKCKHTYVSSVHVCSAVDQGGDYRESLTGIEARAVSSHVQRRLSAPLRLLI